MTDSSHDLGNLHIDRDTPPAVRRAFTRNLVLAAERAKTVLHLEKGQLIEMAGAAR